MDRPAGDARQSFIAQEPALLATIVRANAMRNRCVHRQEFACEKNRMAFIEVGNPATRFHGKDVAEVRSRSRSEGRGVFQWATGKTPGRST